MALTLMRARPAAPPRPAVITPEMLPSRNRARDFFEKVVRPDLNDPEEAKVAFELRRRITEWQSAESEFLRNTEVEFEFLSGRHWVDNIQNQDRAQELNNLGRSAFTIDLITPSLEIVVNQIRINKTTANFIPLSDGADRATAQVRQGLYRNIERQSKAPIARETAYYMAVAVGRGYYRILIEDEDGATFNRRLAFRRVDSLEALAIDPTCLDFNYADAGWAYTFDDLWKDEFRSTYGSNTNANGDPIDLDIGGLSLLNDVERQFWFPKDKVKVGEYFRRRWRDREVVRIEDGTDWWKDEAPDGARIIRTKKKPDSYLEYRKMTGTQTLEKRIWPGKLIPIIVVVGREVFRGKKPKINSGMVRPAMDPSKINDYMTSRMVDEVALSPLPHMFAATGHFQIEQKQLVNTINRHPWSILEYTPQEDSEGRALPPPGWASPSPNTAAVVQAAASAKDSLQRVLNTFAPQLGALQGDQSGRAITAVKDQGDVSHAAFPDNYNRAILYEAEVINELMDVVYTEPQAITITEPDESTTNVLINQEYVDQKSGKTKLHLFGGSKYGVIATTGASYPTRMAEAAERILDLAKVFPGEIVKTLDLIIKGLNIPDADKYADRLRPPGVTGDDELPSQEVLMQHIQAQEQNLQQADGLIKQLLQKVQELGSKEALERLKIASKERIAAADNMAGIIESEIKAGQEASHEMLVMELQQIIKQLDQAQDVQAEADQMNQPPAGQPQPAATSPVPAGPSAPGAPVSAAPQQGPTGLNPPQQ